MTIRENSVIDSFDEDDANNNKEKESEKDKNNNDLKFSLNYEENKSGEVKNKDGIDACGDEEPLTWIDAESFGSVFTHHGSNLFLRLGALGNIHNIPVFLTTWNIFESELK